MTSLTMPRHIIIFLLVHVVMVRGFTLTCVSGPAATVHRSISVHMSLPYDKTREGEYPHPHDSDYQFGDITKRVIRDLTGNKDYELGDGTKVVAQATLDAAEAAAEASIAAGGTAAEAGAAARKALDDSGYQFGDITKGVLKGFEKGVQEVTGNNKYQFGDLTKNLAKGLFNAVEKGAASAKDQIEDTDRK
uniref:Uncharacterized protein n=1 Tax=Coccolithus braarudii TaxID=221442 RepID=A0A7S0LMU0_9EUKA